MRVLRDRGLDEFDRERVKRGMGMKRNNHGCEDEKRWGESASIRGKDPVCLPGTMIVWGSQLSPATKMVIATVVMTRFRASGYWLDGTLDFPCSLPSTSQHRFLTGFMGNGVSECLERTHSRGEAKSGDVR